MKDRLQKHGIIKFAQMLKKILVFCLFCCISFYSYAHFNEIWEDVTPYGKKFFYEEDTRNGIEYISDSIRIFHVSKWYFYKGFTVGISQKDSLGNAFFASDEVKNKFYQFKDEQSWKTFLNQNNLNPIYIRWYYKYWSNSPKYFGSDGIETFFLWVGIILIIIAVLLISFIGNVVAYFLNQTETPFSFFSKVMSVIWKIIWKSVLFFWIPLFIINYLLGAFPQSL